MSSWHQTCFTFGWITLSGWGKFLTGRLAYMLLTALVLAIQPAWAQYGKPLVQAEVSRMADTAHVEFRGLKNWRYDVQRDGSKQVHISIAPIDEASVARLQGFSDPLISEVK